MRDIHIIPKNRDKQAVIGYKMISWFVRANKEEIKTEMEKAFTGMLLYGQSVMKDGRVIRMEDLYKQ